MLLLYGNASLTSAEGLTSLSSVASYIQVEYSAFTNFHLPSLSRAWVIIIGQSGKENEHLESIRLPSLRSATSLTLVGNPILHTLEIPTLQLLTNSLFISFTPALPSCRIEALLAQLRARPLEVNLYDLDPNPVCE